MFVCVHVFTCNHTHTHTRILIERKQCPLSVDDNIYIYIYIYGRAKHTGLHPYVRNTVKPTPISQICEHTLYICEHTYIYIYRQ